MTAFGFGKPGTLNGPSDAGYTFPKVQISRKILNHALRIHRMRNPRRKPASCITFLSEQAFAPQNTRFWSRSRVWFQFTVG